MAEREPAPLGTLAVGTRVRLRSSGVVGSTSAGFVSVQTDEGEVLTLSPNMTVLVLEVPAPSTVGSAVLASVNGGPDEVLTLTLNNNNVARWFQPSSRGFLTAADSVLVKTVIYQAPVTPAAPVPARLQPGQTK
jgi:hypothetical protein